MDIQIPQILFQIINFGVVAGALTYFLYKPVLKVLEERSKKIEEAQKAAEVTLAEKRQIDEMKKKAQKDAEKEAAKLLEEATQAAASRKKELLAKAKEEAIAEKSKAMQSFEEEKSVMVENIQKEFNSAVVAAVEKVIGAFDKKQHAQLIDKELDKLLERI
jgi:F-type H+-transporting ATPase subunit b